MRHWIITGIIATLVIMLSVPLYLVRVSWFKPFQQYGNAGPSAAFTGSKECMTCHKKEYDAWKGSHHDHAMDVASDSTVLGDFNNVTFENNGIRSRFYRKDGRFYVYTQGPEGKMADFEITHTFGWFPLQQYLVPFPGGRMQCLSIAWDEREKRWYDLNPDTPVDPSDWLHWTNAAQNWNGMCAECHSTNLKKNYDIKTNTYNTSWSEIDVSCEACHGPASLHVEWAQMPEMARPQKENCALPVRTKNLPARELVELCAPCHSRRAILGDYTHDEPDLLDSMLPSLLQPGLYYPDGQILEEVYVYGSFTQSKMYHRDVRCSDCHDVHKLTRIKDGNDLCLQCHRKEEYDTREHHFHKTKNEKGTPIRSKDGRVLFDVGSGAQCVACHMPGRNYMGIDYRPDHSLRIPRPDLSLSTGAPNACNRCHYDKTEQWSEDAVSKWYGPGRRGHYGSILDAGRKALPRAEEELGQLAQNPLYPVIVRATALSLLSGYPGKDTDKTFALSLMDEEALIRQTAIEYFRTHDEERMVRLISPLLYDPVKAVRIEAASKLCGSPSLRLDPSLKRRFERVLDEYIDAMTYSGDFAANRHNLGNLYMATGKVDRAVEHYKAAIAIDNLYYPAKINLGMLYNQLGRKDEAEKLFRQSVAEHPDLYEAAYSLGLLLIERENYTDAVTYLSQAARGLPDRARIHYNLGLLLESMGRLDESQVSLSRALSLEPDNLDFLHAMAVHYFKTETWDEAESMVQTIIRIYPASPLGPSLKRALEQIEK